MDWLEQERVRRKEAATSLTAMREAVRKDIMAKAVLYPDTPLIYENDFDGYGDSGQMYPNSTYPESVNKILSEALNAYVTFDWYDNDGGGGDITWDVIEDKITINGYQNVTTQESMMDGEEF